jgi:hypothetical protein
MPKNPNVKAELIPIPSEKPPLFSRWDPTIDPPSNGIYRYWSHFADGKGLWTLWIESSEPVGEISREVHESYPVTVSFLAEDAPHDVLKAGNILILSVGNWKKASLKIL